MTRSIEVKPHLVHLDFLRGTAALLVCLEHLRAFLFVPFRDLASPGVAAKAFYLVTGLGHQAVMVFFVLSGFLVGGSVQGAFRKGNWGWKEYLLRRLTRLWVVLIPSLLLTLAWDRLGIHLAPAGYSGGFHGIYNSGPTPEVPAALGFPVFLGNIAFLQTVLVPCFGTNGPLWSLANEFWYYLLFPLLLGCVAGDGPRARILSWAAAAGIMVFLPAGLLEGGLIWGLGAWVHHLLRHDGFRRIAGTVPFLAAGCFLTSVSLIASRCGMEGFLADACIGCGVAVLVAGLATRDAVWKPYRQLARWGSEISYTLYLVHFPLLAFLFFVFFQGGRCCPGLAGLLGFSAILLALLAYAAGVWWCFERNTDRIRAFLEGLLSRSRP